MPSTTIFPTLRYENAPAAIDWLCTVLGFEKHVVYESEGLVMHAQLRHGDGMIMIGSKRDGPFDALIKTPRYLENVNTQSCYIYIPDLEKHYEHVKASGTEIVLPLKQEDHGAGYTCRDPEGYLWNFGNYNPYDTNELNQ